jgi:hypothetical protein
MLIADIDCFEIVAFWSICELLSSLPADIKGFNLEVLWDISQVLEFLLAYVEGFGDLARADEIFVLPIESGIVPRFRRFITIEEYTWLLLNVAANWRFPYATRRTRLCLSFFEEVRKRTQWLMNCRVNESVLDHKGHGVHDVRQRGRSSDFHGHGILEIWKPGGSFDAVSGTAGFTRGP